MIRIFLSSTFKDLQRERAAVEAAIDRASLKFVGMEHFGSFGDEPLNRSVAKVRSADAFVLLLGCQYGFVPNGSDISMTESEYREARNIEIPVFAYLADTPDDMYFIDDPRLVELRTEVTTVHGVSLFYSPEDLAWKVISDILREFWADQPSALESLSNALLVETVQGSVQQLIDILDFRAANIIASLSPLYRYAKVKTYLVRFKELHEKHVDSLRRGKMLEAHEVVGEIHRLSAELDADEFWTDHRINHPSWCYSMRPDAFIRGPMICGYIGGDVEDRSETYPSENGFPGRREDVSPTVTLRLYEQILQTNGA